MASREHHLVGGNHIERFLARDPGVVCVDIKNNSDFGVGQLQALKACASALF
ncbi:MAG: hypothetical protein GY947_10765 [Rhodobacteraceae bacterium]|nr:hypothetical protein [Paracoccaceae bacterium]